MSPMITQDSAGAWLVYGPRVLGGPCYTGRGNTRDAALAAWRAAQ